MNQFSTARTLSVCFVHDWLVKMRGGEKVLEAMCELFPEAPIYTLFVNRKKLSPALQAKKINTSCLQWIPGIEKIYRYLLPIFPLAIKSFDIQKYELIISSSHCVAKAVSKQPKAKHVCYCHTPMRYLWGFEEEYLGRLPKWVRSLIKLYFQWLKSWDVRTSRKVDYFIANSKNTANKIKEIYSMDSVTINPPVDDLAHQEEPNPKEGYYLIVSALVQYKRVDLAIQAFNELELPLKIIGDGPLMSDLKRMVCYDGIEFLGWVETWKLWQHYKSCKALIFPGEEDFGIVPLEAQMCGKPVVAFGKGGVTETITSQTGIFFNEPTAGALVQAIQKSRSHNFDPDAIRKHALSFNKSRFKEQMMQFLQKTIVSF